MPLNIEGGIITFFFIGVLTGLAASSGRDAVSRLRERFGGKNTFIVILWLCGFLLWLFTSEVADFLGVTRSEVTLLAIVVFILPTVIVIFQERQKIHTSYKISKEYGSAAKKSVQSVRSKVRRD